MKRILIALSALVAALGALAQVDVQLHYDFGRNLYPDSEADRAKLTATIEQFRPDRLGSIFYFVDFDFYRKGMKGAYLEFSREFNIKNGFAAHIEYNGGLTSGHASEYASQFQHALLLGGAWNGHSADFRRTLSLQAMYKQYFKGHGNQAFSSFQLTGVWSVSFARGGMFTFSGFADLWLNRHINGDHDLIFITEPQFWFNFDSLRGARKTGLSIGTEIEMSNNFIYPTSASAGTFYCNPTLALKWTMR